MTKYCSKFLLLIIFILILCTSIAAQASTGNQKALTKKQSNAKKIAAEKWHTEQVLKRKELQKPISTSGLDKKEQVKELTQILAYIYNIDELFTDLWQNPASPYTRILNLDKKACVKAEFNKNKALKLLKTIAENHVSYQSTEKNQQDLQLLIDSGLSYELHNVSHASLVGDDDYQYVVQLHILQQPKLAFAVKEIVNNPDYKELAKIILVNVKPEDTFLGELLRTAADKCHFKLNAVE
jgi:hypothetical protein